MSVLYPEIDRSKLSTLLKVAGLGALVAGLYGALHDQISYTISPEYFTKLKFHQFAWADLGWPPRVFASVIGLLATWWVGLLGGWFLARAGLAEVPSAKRRRVTAVAFGLVGGAAVVCGIAGLFFGRYDGTILNFLANDLAAAGVEDPRAFATVAGLHDGGYLGALVGLIAAVLYVRSHRVPKIERIV
jgi:hypothetical protein